MATLTMSLHWIDKMAVEVDGEGDPVVMVHGLGGTTNTWTPLLPALTNAKRIRIELPGSGRSHRAHALQDNTPNKGQLSIDMLVDAVLRVCAQLGVSARALCGSLAGHHRLPASSGACARARAQPRAVRRAARAAGSRRARD